MKNNFVKSKLLALVLMVLPLSVLSANTLQKKLDNLIIATEDYPPISFKNKNNKADGLASEVAYEIMKNLNMKQSIHVWPWARDYKLLKKGPNYLVFSVSRTPEREKLFQWVGPIYSMKTGFYVKKSSNIKIDNLDDAKKIKKIGTYFESFDEQFLKKEHFKNLESTKSNILNIKKLMGNRFDVITATNVTIGAMMKKAGYSISDVKNLYNFMNVGVYFAFSKEVSKDVVDAWQKELDKMNQNGSLAKIRNKWLMK